MYSVYMEKLLKIYLRVFLLITPLFFLPITTDAYGIGKNIWLMVGALGGMALWLAGMIKNKKFEVKVSKAWWVWLLLTVLSFISFTKVPLGVQSRSWLQPLGVTTMVAMLAWFWLFLQTQDKEENKMQMRFLTISGIILTVLSLITFLLPAKLFPILIPKTNAIMSITQGWSLTGSVLAELTLLLVLVAWWAGELVTRYRKGSDYVAAAVVTAVTALGVFLNIYKIVKLGIGWLNITTSWAIATEAFKQSPLWGSRGE